MCVYIHTHTHTHTQVLRRPLPSAPVAVLHVHCTAVQCVAASDGLDAGASAARDGSCRVFQLSSGVVTHQLAHPAGAPVDQLALSVEGDLVMCAAGDHRLHLFDVNAKAVTSARSQGGGVTVVSVSPNGQLLLTGTTTGAVHIYRLSSLALLASLAPPSPPACVDALALSPCSNFLLCGYAGGAMTLHTNDARLVTNLKQSLQDLGIGEGGLGAL